MSEAYEVVVESGALRSDDALLTAPHRWTAAGVAVHGAFTGAHLLHLAVGGCVLNDVHREAAELGVALEGVRVVVRGGFEEADWSSTGIEYVVEIDSAAPDGDLARLLERVDSVAEIPRAVRAGARVQRI